MENNIKNRAFQWIKLELAFEVYWVKRFLDEDNNFSREEARQLWDGLMFYSWEYISIEKNWKCYIDKKSYICWERDEETEDMIDNFLSQYELPEDITDILILKLIK